eukprot:gnl/Trimastix_PCT/3594.p1 GENE.gnl/Trimastix_PCT/3594~~gnl/Trimastix_PCT/3594.p1  ORF type:complete len:291 (-),score=68.69 gnl/Trimastix_PCT/3594:71-943(-)
MSMTDRTSEFVRAAEALRRSGGSTIVHRKPRPDPPLTNIQRLSELIPRSIEEMKKNLKLLRNAQKIQDPFSNMKQKIQDLTYLIKHDIDQLNQQIAQLSLAVKQQRPPNQHTQLHSEKIVEALKLKLLGATESFHAMLRNRTEHLERQQERQQKFSSTRAAGAHRQGQFFDYQDEPSGDITVSFDDDDAQLAPLATQTRYLQGRGQALNSIQRTIGEVGRMFQELTRMVSEQGEQLRLVDANLDSTLDNMEAATGQLRRTYNRAVSNRWLILKIFGVLAVFIILFGWFMK